MTELVAEAARKDAQCIVFPETALTGYGPAAVARASAADIAAAEADMRAACRQHGIASIFGTPRDGFNSALVVSASGAEICRQHKMQLVPTDLPWTQTAGSTVRVFDIVPGWPCAVIICHDKRYPELCRLPVLAGARAIIYIAAESWHDDLPLPAPREPPWTAARLAEECGVYRAQAQARAVENRVWLVKSNVAGSRDEPLTGSHGGSSIIDPTGIVMQEAGMYDEVLVCHTLDLAEANAAYANKSVCNGYALAGWWQEALPQVERVKHVHVQ